MSIHELVGRIERQLKGIDTEENLANACYQIWREHERKKNIMLRLAFDDGITGRPPTHPSDQNYMTEYRSGLSYSGHKVCDLH